VRSGKEREVIGQALEYRLISRNKTFDRVKEDQASLVAEEETKLEVLSHPARKLANVFRRESKPSAPRP